MTGNQVPLMIFAIIACLINISLNLILIPGCDIFGVYIEGMEGAAIASFTSIVFLNYVMVIYIDKKFNFISTYIPGLK